MEEVVGAPGVPPPRAYIERVIGTIRKMRTDAEARLKVCPARCVACVFRKSPRSDR
jgi:hypothetical protein